MMSGAVGDEVRMVEGDAVGDASIVIDE